MEHMEEWPKAITIRIHSDSMAHVNVLLSLNIKASFDLGMYEKQPIEISHGKHRNGKARHTRYK